MDCSLILKFSKSIIIVRRKNSFLTLKIYLSPNRIILFLFLIISFYAIIIIYFDFSKILLSFQNFDLKFIPLILVLVLSGLFLRSMIQNMFLKQIGIILSFKENLVLFFSSFSMMITPGGIGMLIKSHFLKNKYSFSISKTLPVIFFERINDLIIISSIVSILSIFNFQFESLFVIVSSLFILLLILFFIKNKQLTNLLKFLERKIPFIKIGTINGDELDKSINELMKFKSMSKSLFLTASATTLEGLAVILCFHAFGTTFNNFQIIQSYFTSLFLGALSFIPGGLGIVEGSLIGLLIAQGFESSYAISIVIFVRFFLFWFGVSLGFIVAYRFFIKSST